MVYADDIRKYARFRQRSVSRPDTAWIGRGTAFSTPKAQRRCTLLVVWYSEQEEPFILTDLASGGSQLVRPALLDRVGLQVKSLGWKWDKPAHRPHPRLPALARPVGGHPGPWPMAGGRPGAEDCSRQPADAAQSAGNHRDPWSRPARTVSVINRLAPALAAQGPPAASGCCPNPGQNPSSTWRLLAMSHRKNPIPTPVRGGTPKTTLWSLSTRARKRFHS